ncbi:ribonuclease P protein subunit p40-like [Anopheles marshallii]|uniref:ribonuclease P protein subunit p40-like n=1 Tax=Anopheles marshallii TaxID=1521116 RepID=UPI00237C0471|nr:ribonuclease P protein subunit p40-like [Anopheles marshallii]
MLCPELWKFPIPTCSVERIVSPCWSKMKKMNKIRKYNEAHPLKRMVSVVIPANEPQCLLGLEADFDVGCCKLYRVRHFPVMEMLKKEFVEAFVKRGTLYAVSTYAKMESEDCLAIMPCGALIISLHRETAEKLQGNFNINVWSQNRDKCVIKIDLKSANARQQIKDTMVTFDITLRWIPPDNECSKSNTDMDVTVSGSSIAKYLHDICQLNVENVAAGCKKTQRFDESIPMMRVNNLSSDETGKTSCTNDELLEYIGMLALDCTTTPIEYVSSYMMDKPQLKPNTVSIFHRNGLITAEEVNRSIMRLTKLVNECHTIPWVGLHVQGICNVPLHFMHHGENGVYWNYDSAYTMVITNQNLLWSNSFGGVL